MTAPSKRFLSVFVGMVLIYAVTPFFAGVVGSCDRRGPKIFSETHHEVLYRIGYALVRDGKPRVAFQRERPWFYGIVGAPLPATSASFDVARPFKLDFGRGSGRRGLDTIAITEEGQVAIHRAKGSGSWECSSLRLSPEQLREVAEAVARHGLLLLEKQYHADVADGVQWVLRIQQGGRKRACYFDNSFPAAIRHFAGDLDGILRSAGYDSLRWKPVESRQHEKELWDSIETPGP